MLYAGIIGLPNVGKSSLFNALTKSNVPSDNFLFQTTAPNIGIVELQDERLEVLKEIYNSAKTIPVAFELVDIPALVSGSSTGEGLGNNFLASIRDVDAVCHVVRCFEDDNVLHVNNKIDPLNDIETIELELNFADLDQITKRLPRLEKKAKSDPNSLEKKEYDLLLKLKAVLEEYQPIRSVQLDTEEEKIIKSFNFLSAKPMLYIANVGEEDFSNLDNNEHYLKVLEKAKEEKSLVIPICAKLEEELNEMDFEEGKLFLEDLNILESGINKLASAVYETLGLSTFFTCGPKQIKAWTYKNGLTAKECAGIIHSDFERGFIRAEVIKYNDLVHYGSELKCKENGKARLEGKDYLVLDGDLILFRFNV